MGADGRPGPDDTASRAGARAAGPGGDMRPARSGEEDAGPPRPGADTPPPRPAEALLWRLVGSRPSARFIVGDLREELAAVRRRRGRLLAACWYWLQVLRFVGPTRPARLDRSHRPAGTGRGLGRPAAEGGRPGGIAGHLPPRRPRKETAGMLDSLAHDLRSAIHSTTGRPGLTLTAVLILALAIGATTAIFSVVDGVLLAPLPFPDSERIVRLGWRWEGGGSATALSWLKLDFWEEHGESFTALASYRGLGVELEREGGTREVLALGVTDGFLEVLGVSPVVGRDFAPGEDEPGGPDVALIGQALWQERFGGDPGVVGRTLEIDNSPHTVIGVLPEGFELPTMSEYTGLLVPLRLQPDPGDRGHNYTVIGRLREGLDPAAAAEREQRVTGLLAEAYPDRVDDGDGLVVVGFLDPHIGAELRLVLWVLMGAVGLVLLIACANVANLLLVSASGRQRELAARTALGASRGRIVRQLLVESLLLAAVASVAGVALAWLTLDVLLAMVPQELPRAEDIGLDLRVLSVTLASAGGTGLLFGTAAAIPATRVNARDALQEGGRTGTEGPGRSLLRKVLVAGQVAVSTVLLSAAIVLMVTFVNMRGADLGFDVDGLHVVRLQAAGPMDADSIRALEAGARRAAAAFPGVEAAATAGSVPLERGWNIPVGVAPVEGEAMGSTVEFRAVSAGYFETLGTPILRGRGFTANDTAGGAPVAVVNEALARSAGPEEVLGAAVAIGYLIRNDQWVAPQFESHPSHRVVGVVTDVKEYGADASARPTVYVPLDQAPAGLVTIGIPRLLVRTASGSTALAGLDQRLLEAEPRLREAAGRPMSASVATATAGERFNAVLMGSFGGLALLLTLAGLYGLLAYAVGRRTHEIGIRMALGAPRRRMLGMVFREAAGMVAVGLVLGLAGALVAGRLLSSLVYEVSPTDPVLLGLAAVSLVLVAAVACWIPGRRATRVDPVEALRAEA